MSLSECMCACACLCVYVCACECECVRVHMCVCVCVWARCGGCECVYGGEVSGGGGGRGCDRCITQWWLTMNSPLFTFTFTFSHLADVFVQSDVQGREQSS